MKTKLITLEQVSLLKKHDIIEKYPSRGSSREIFDERDTELIDIYEIRSFNLNNNMLELVMTGSSVHMLSLAGDIGRLFIKSCDLLTGGIWWFDDTYSRR